MVAELNDDLRQAAKAGIDPTEFLGGDPDGFARAWASERGVIRPRLRLASTTVAATASMLPGAAFAAVLPLLATSEWGLSALVEVFPGQRDNTNLDCLTGPRTAAVCGSASWDTPMWFIAVWYAIAIGIVCVGALGGSSAWLRRCADPLRLRTLRWIAVALPAAGLAVGACLAFLDKTNSRSRLADLWIPVIAFTTIATVFAARALVVTRGRRQADRQIRSAEAAIQR